MAKNLSKAKQEDKPKDVKSDAVLNCTYSLTEATKVAVQMKAMNAKSSTSIDSRLNSLLKKQR